jgi:hypothetical protein
MSRHFVKPGEGAPVAAWPCCMNFVGNCPEEFCILTERAVFLIPKFNMKKKRSDYSKR